MFFKTIAKFDTFQFICGTPNQHHAKKLSPKIALPFKVLCESKAMLPMNALQLASYLNL